VSESIRQIMARVAEGAARGEAVEIEVGDGERPWRVWIELAERMGVVMATPRSGGDGRVVIRFEPIESEAEDEGKGKGQGTGTEKYGVGSEFGSVCKLEEPGFVIDVREALARCALVPDALVLDLGCNTGDELELVYEAAPDARIVGVDHAASAIACARERFPRATFHAAEFAALASLALGRFDLVMSIDTLQSPGIDDRALLRQLVQDHLAPRGAVIIGLPNSRYANGELVYGARMRNFSQPELGLLVKDVAFYRKYLQQHHRQVFVTGRHEILITAIA